MNVRREACALRATGVQLRNRRSAQRSQFSSVWPVLRLLAAAAVLAAAAGCALGSASAQPQAHPTTAATTGPKTPGSAPTGATPAAQPDDDPTASVTAHRPPDPTAPATVRPVDRPGRAATSLVAVRNAPFGHPIAWTDGVTLSVTRVQHGVTAGRGPGAVSGSPVTRFSLMLRNGSASPVDAIDVVTTVVYGSTHRKVAPLVYDDASADFGARVAPKGTTTAVYSYVIPPADLGAVRLTVDLDGHHGLATFSGSVR